MKTQHSLLSIKFPLSFCSTVQWSYWIHDDDDQSSVIVTYDCYCETHYKSYIYITKRLEYKKSKMHEDCYSSNQAFVIGKRIKSSCRLRLVKKIYKNGRDEVEVAVAEVTRATACADRLAPLHMIAFIIVVRIQHTIIIIICKFFFLSVLTGHFVTIVLRSTTV